MSLTFRRLLPVFGLDRLWDARNAPAIEGFFQADLREGGKLRQHVEGFNIWTLTGRELLAEIIAIKYANPREVYRDDRIAYIGLGAGSQSEVAEVTSLVDAVPYSPGEFLAPVAAPATFPSSSTSTNRTSVRFVREYGLSEISLGYNVTITEAGLFTDGNPDDDWALNAPTGIDAAADRAPMAYKTFEPITKTTSYTLRLSWEVRFI